MGVRVQAHTGVHHLAVVLAGLLALHQLLESAEAAEWIHDDAAGIGVGAKENLTLGDVTGIVRDGVGDITVVQGGDGDDRYGAACGQLHRLLVDFGKVGIQGTGHGILRGDLVHTVADYGQGVSVQRHVRQQYEHFLVLVNGKVLRRRKGHVGDEQTLHGRILGRVHEGNDAVQCAGVLEGVTEEQVVVVAQSHSSQDDLVHVCAEGDLCHNLVVWLVGVREEGDLLAGHERVVKVDAGDTCGDKLAGLAAFVRVHGRAAGLALLSFDLGTAVDGLAVGVEETAGQLLAHLEGRGSAEERHFRVRGHALGTGEHLQGYAVAVGLYHLRQLAVYAGKLVVGYALGVQGHGGLGYGLQLRVSFLVCFHNAISFTD